MAYKSTKQLNKTHPELQPRKIPAQKRAELTVTRILDTAALLLEEFGLDGFNTNLLAKRADMRVATIYRYFPNKLAILSALVQRWMNTLRDGMTVIGELADPELDWRKTVGEIVNTYTRLSKEHVGYLAIRRAMQAAPELREMELNFVRELSLLTVEAMQTRGVKTKKSQLINFAETYFVAGSAAAELAFIRKKKNQTFNVEIIEETRLMSIGFFAHYLD